MAIQVTSPALEITDGYGSSVFTTSLEAGTNLKVSDDGYGAVILDGYRPHVIYVNLTDGDFSSIKAAVDSITTASLSSPYIVDVAPGLYIEDTITLKPYVWLQGAEQDQTIIQVDSPSKHVIVGSDNSGLSKVKLQGATDPGSAGVFYQSTTGTTRDAFFIEDIRFGENDTLAISDGYYASTAIFVESCKFGSYYQFNNGFLAQNAGRMILRNSTTTGLTTPYPNYIIKATGVGSEVVTNGVQMRSGGISGGVGIQLSDGAHLRATAINIKGFDVGLWIENAGAAATVNAVGFLCEDNTYDLRVEHPAADGTFNGSADHTKIFVDPSSPFSVVISCNRFPSDNTGSVTVGSILQGDRFDRIANLSLLAREATTLGVIDGGDVSIASGFDVDITAGSGFLLDQADQYIKEIHWSATTLTIPADSIRYIYVDTNSTVQQAASSQSLITTIPLGRVVTDGSGVRFIEEVEMDMVHIGNKIERFLRALGPVFGQGAIVSENGNRQLDVTSGQYNYGVNQLALAGGSPISWTAFYMDGSGGWIETGSQSTVSNSEYDDGTGTLASIPSGQFVKHSLYAIGDLSNESYFLVYGQAYYPTKEDAIAADLPLVPPFISDAVVRLAGLVVEQGNNNFPSGGILDLRPRIGFAAPATAGTTDHGSLLGLDDDDHPQYLLVDGSRAMTGSLDMGGQSITNINLVDGIDVTAHGSRHLPNGADPITTASAVTVSATTTNSTGIANSLARSDHGHAVPTAAPVTQTPDQSNAVGSSSSLARADHVHNIPATAPTTTLAPSTTNAEGTAASFARGDHTHAVATALVGDITTIQPDATASAGTADNFARGDHRHAIDAAAPSGSLGGTSTNTEGSSTSFSRADHTHDIATGNVSTQIPDQSNSEGSSNNLARADHVHNIPAEAPITTLAPSTTNAEGTADSFARSDHTHEIATATASSITTILPDTAASAGTADNFARGDHVHAIDAAAPTGALGGTSTNTEGVSTSFSRADHTHDIATGVVSTQIPDQSNAEGSSNNLARADHVHNIPADAPTTTLAPSTTNAEGTANSFARSDHTHAVATALVGDITTIQPDATASAGTADNFARGDHRHAIDAAAPSTALSATTSNTEGSSTSFARADHVHSILTGVVSTQLADQSNATGTSANIARADHIHNIPTTTPVAIGTANAQGTSTSFVKADHVHQGVHSIDVNGGTDRYGDLTLQQGSGVTITDNGSGTFTIAATVAALSPRILLYADQLDSPFSGNWAVSTVAPSSSDTLNSALTVRRFDDTAEEGVGWLYSIPSGVTNINFTFKSRRQTAGSAQNVILRMYTRQIPNGSAVSAWSSALQLSTIAMGTTTAFQYNSQTISLATLGITAGNLVQFELTRHGANASDTLSGDWDLIEIGMEFS